MKDFSSTVAIVGIGAIFPDGPDLESFWKHIEGGHSSFRTIPEQRWIVRPDDVFSPEPGKADSVYSRTGCFINDLPSAGTLAGLHLDSGRLEGLDPLYHLLIHAGKRAYDDGVTSHLDRNRVGIIIGNLALPTESAALLTRSVLGRTFEERLIGTASPAGISSPFNRYVAGLPAGILAQALGLGGGACTLDAACASSLYALKLAMDELLSGRADAMLSGGVSRPDPLFTQMGFSQLRALSKRGICSPFDAAGDGLVVGEGAGIFLLKRTADAIAQGDRIYGIIRGVGVANDVGGSLLAPMSEGQLRAMGRAYGSAGWQPTDVDLIECHATGTPVGDGVEVASLRQLWGDRSPVGERCVIGSVKSNIGHLLTAAGSAAVTKVLLSFQHGTLPPTANFNSPQVGMKLDDSPFRVLQTPLPWHRRNDDTPRRAAVSAFGFGGINAHLLLEEWLPTTQSNVTFSLSPSPPDAIAIIGINASFGPWQTMDDFQDRVFGGDSDRRPLSPTRWHGVRESNWFKNEHADGTPFAGYYRNQVSLSSQRFRIPPREMEEMLPQQLLMLHTAAEALSDAGCGADDNGATGVFIGIALDLNSTNFNLRWAMAGQTTGWARQLGRDLTPAEQDQWTAELRDAVHAPLTANRTMGALGSVVASRIAREFRIGGPSFTLSSEDNSGIRALEVAIRQLQNRELDRALVGAVDLAGDVRAVLGQHEIRPCSRSGISAPFDRNADGIIVGEGASAVVLKRLADAERDSDKIYAVIRGIGSVSGSPDEAAAVTYGRALEKAYQEAAIDPASTGFVEASADGSLYHDSDEREALTSFFTNHSTPHRSCAVSSIKGDIGHSGAASGLASLVRGSLALHHEIIPGCRGLALPPPSLADNSPLHFPRSPRYWLHNRSDGLRHAGVSVRGIDGSCSHVVLEEYGKVTGVGSTSGPLRGTGNEFIFPFAGSSPAALGAELDLMVSVVETGGEEDFSALALRCFRRFQDAADVPCTIAMVARGRDELRNLLVAGKAAVTAGTAPEVPPSLRDRLFYSPNPLGTTGKIAFVFPGSGNHYPSMGMELFSRWPGILRRQNSENMLLRAQFQPELFWNDAPLTEINDDHRAVIFGQVATGCAVSDLVRSFGVQPSAVIGYSLGESAGLFALRAWRDRDAMYSRMKESTLFTDDLAGTCQAARAAWKLAEGEEVRWSLGVIAAPEQVVRDVLTAYPHSYLLIVNTPDECVIGGDATELAAVVATLNRSFFPLYGVTTVHCEVAAHVAAPYHDLHLFPTTVPEGITFYSGVAGSEYMVSRESAADSILGQALHGVNYPDVINSAYGNGVRLFLEMGPGASCSRMIDRILADRPHVARSACHGGVDPISGIVRLLANLIAEQVPVDLSPLFTPALVPAAADENRTLTLQLGGLPYHPAPPPRRQGHQLPVAEPAGTLEPMTDRIPTPASSIPATTDSLIQEMMKIQESRIAAHTTFLTVSETITRSMAEAINLEMSLRQILGDEAPVFTAPTIPMTIPMTVAFDRDACFEFARGSVGRMLGSAFAEVDSFPTRVRLPDEPLMLVDRILRVEGEPRSMGKGRVITEHDINRGAWYLDGGCIPTCIAVESGQADLFLTGYLGIDFITRGLAVYRLLDAVVTFHRGLPGPGETIQYDIRIERFFRQGDTWLFRFFFEATVNGQPLLSMRDGCAGFFSQRELDAGKGIVRPALDLRPVTGIRPDDWRDLLPQQREGYDAAQLDRLRSGDLVGCFGPLFDRITIAHPLTIPGGRMRLVHRVTEIDPTGGRCGMGIIRAEADIHPDDWFITCHFVDDRVMPGTLMYECCMHTLRIYLLRLGWIADGTHAVWEPVPGVASKLCCRGQVLESTKTVTYEVTVREIGYGPEPYAIVDALMYADGKAIVEITSMSARLTGTTREQLEQLWWPASQPDAAAAIKPPLYTKEQILAYSNGKPSEGFGDRYQVFDAERKIARLPGPPFQFMDRVTAVSGTPWQMTAGARVESQYDLPVDAWFIAVERQKRMPFSVLLEAALQPCGWLAAYVGSALTSPTDISFRNLGGSAIQHRTVTPQAGVLTCCAALKKVATSGGMIIQEYDFSVADRRGVLYEGETMFGFFAKEALAQQVGIRDGKPYQPADDEIARGESFPYPTEAPFPDTRLRMIDRVEMYVATGGPGGLGYIRGVKDVNPEEWFFKAHFYEDPVTPGSLGLESFIQLMKYVAYRRWGWQDTATLSAVALNHTHRWLYRGQVVPTNSRVTVHCWITAVDDIHRIITADGFLEVDGKLIYQMNDFTVSMENI